MGSDDIEIDLTTADRPDGLPPIRWVPGATGPHTNGHPNGHANGTGHTDGATAIAPRIVSLTAFIPPAPPAPAPNTPMITLLEPEVWSDVPEPVTLRRVMASRGARVLTVLVVAVFSALLAATVLLWQRVEETRRPAAPAQPRIAAVTPDQLGAVQNRLNSIETKLASMLDATGTVVADTPNELQSELAALRGCLTAFQHAIDDGSVRGGRFAYCG